MQKYEILLQNDMLEMSYNLLVIEFRQMLSELTQQERVEIGEKHKKAHPSTEEYWDMMSPEQQQHWMGKFQQMGPKK